MASGAAQPYLDARKRPTRKSSLLSGFPEETIDQYVEAVAVPQIRQIYSVPDGPLSYIKNAARRAYNLCQESLVAGGIGLTLGALYGDVEHCIIGAASAITIQLAAYSCTDVWAILAIHVIQRRLSSKSTGDQRALAKRSLNSLLLDAESPSITEIIANVLPRTCSYIFGAYALRAATTSDIPVHFAAEVGAVTGVLAFVESRMRLSRDRESIRKELLRINSERSRIRREPTAI